MGRTSSLSGQTHRVGIQYEETYPCWQATYPVPVNGIRNIQYTHIATDNGAFDIYNRDFKLSRTGALANGKRFNTGEVWTDELASTSPAIKLEYMDRVSEGAKVDVDVTVDRGNAAAFERHLKLMECNTFQDMEEYGNNYFGL